MKRLSRLRALFSLLLLGALGCTPAPAADMPPVAMQEKTAPFSAPHDEPPTPAPATPEPMADPHHAQGHHGGHAPPEEGDPRAPLVHRFDDTDPKNWAKRFEGPDRDAYQKPAVVLKAMALAPGMAVADIGTGTGYFLPYLSKAVGGEGRVLAVDVAPNMVRHVKARAASDGLANVEARLALLDDPLLATASLDRILIVNTWHHIPERQAYAKKLAAALRPGGKLFVVDFKKTSDKGPPAKHKLEPDAVAAEIGAGGLSAEIDNDSLPEQFIVVGAKPGS